MNDAQIRERLRRAVGEARYPNYLPSRVEARLQPSRLDGRRASQRRSQSPWLAGIGRTGSLLAAVLAVLLISAMVVGVYAWRSASNPHRVAPAAAGPSPSPASFVPMSPPPGGPVPTQLLGNWLLPASAVEVIQGCSSPCGSVELTFTATTYQLTPINNDLYGKFNPGRGEVVVNDTEIDFFNGVGCYQPAGFNGAGRYRWTVTGRILRLTPLNSDPECGRTVYLANQSYGRTS